MTDHLDRARSLHDAIHSVLIKEWDPIGVGHLEEAQDEYDAYIPEIYRMLILRKSKSEVFEYLWWLETEHMGLRGDRRRTEHFAERLISLQAHSSSTVLPESKA